MFTSPPGRGRCRGSGVRLRAVLDAAAKSFGGPRKRERLALPWRGSAWDEASVIGIYSCQLA